MPVKEQHSMCWFMITCGTQRRTTLTSFFAVPDELSLAPELAQILPDLVNAHIEYDYYTHHDITMNATLRVDFDRIWRDSLSGNWENRPIRLMSWEDMLIALCINSCRKRFFRLKALCDVAETVNRGAAQLDWELFLTKRGIMGVRRLCLLPCWRHN